MRDKDEVRGTDRERERRGVDRGSEPGGWDFCRMANGVNVIVENTVNLNVLPCVGSSVEFVI